MEAEPKAWRLAFRSTEWLSDGEKVPFGVPNPRGALADGPCGRVVPLDGGDDVNCSQSGCVVLFEHDTSTAQFAHRFFQIIDFERDLRVLSGWPSRRLKEREPTSTALIPETTRPLLDGIEAELFGVEPSGAVEVLGR